MFTCTLEAASKTPLCEQLYTALKREMERGGIRPGERMPSKRELAAHLSVSTATVEAAYARLISEGLCESRPRSGIYALEQAQRVGLTDGEKPPVRWNFGTGAADAAHFPYATWARLMREVLSEQSATLLLSGDPQGEPALRREIAGYLHRMRGIDAPPEAIVLGAGTEVLVSALVALIGRERLFAVEDPGYSRVRRILVVSGARIAPTPLSGGAIDVRELYRSGAARPTSPRRINSRRARRCSPASGRRFCAGRGRRAAIFWRTITTANSAFPARAHPRCAPWTAGGRSST